MMEHIATLKQLASVKSRNEKIEILKSALQDEEFRKIVKYTLDPYITFGIKDYTINPESSYGADFPFFTELERIAKRELIGLAARETLGQYAIKDEGIEQIIRIILAKDLRCGVGVKTVNEAYPGLIDEFLICLADTYDAFYAEFPLLDSPKPDGVRCVAIVDHYQTVSLRSRSGIEFVSLDILKPEILKFYMNFPDGYVLDGELVSGNLQNTVSQTNRKYPATDEVLFYLFDFIPLPNFLSKLPYKPIEERYLILENLLEDHSGPLRLLQHTYVNNDSEAQAAYQRNVEQGFEGSVFKKPGSQYEFRRTNHWLKLKASDTVDLIVLRMVEGTGKYKGMLGAIIADYKGKEVHIGSGFSDNERVDLWNQMPEVIEVKLQGITPDGSLRHGRFKRVRQDKT